jgi:hypothetical protein
MSPLMNAARPRQVLRRAATLRAEREEGGEGRD